VRTAHHQPIVFGAVADALGAPPELVAPAYAFQSVRSLLSAAQRLGMLGQRDAQGLLDALKAAVDTAVGLAEQLCLDEAGAFAPLWDIASMQHKHAPVRMFAS
jgi:urease accessory protein